MNTSAREHNRKMNRHSPLLKTSKADSVGEEGGDSGSSARSRVI